MSSKLIAVGAEWCGFSSKQQAAIAELKDDKTQASDNVHMVMCQDSSHQPMPLYEGDETWKNTVCAEAGKTIRGYPTWFKLDDAGVVTQIQKNGDQSLHFMASDAICSGLEAAGEKCK